MTEDKFLGWYAGIGAVTAIVLFFTREEDLRSEWNFWGTRKYQNIRYGRLMAIYRVALIGTIWPSFVIQFLFISIRRLMRIIRRIH